MSIPLSKQFLESIYSVQFKNLNHFSPDLILEYWNLTTKVADEYEALAGITPSQKRIGCLMEDIIEITYKPDSEIKFKIFLGNT